MKGSYEVIVGNKRLRYKFTVRRNITILRGDSATGKTTLIDMIGAYEESGINSGVDVRCERPCTVLAGNRWEAQLKEIKGSIVFIDEGEAFISSKDFARAIKKTDNYYVIATRESLFELPYSVEEIFGIRNVTRSKDERVQRLYSAFYPIYEGVGAAVAPDVVIVEDSNAGYQFFKELCNRSGVRCVTARGRARVREAVLDCDADESILVVADGAAFGPEMEGVLSLRQVRHVGFFLPESFEWLILKSGLVRDSDIPTILDDPAAFIESRRWFSWERFFSALLSERTHGTYLAYSKSRLNDAYLRDDEMASIGAQVPMLDGNQ